MGRRHLAPNGRSLHSLRSRVRAQLGRPVTHPRALDRLEVHETPGSVSSLQEPGSRPAH